MLNRSEIHGFYKVVRRYRDHDKTICMLVNHFFPKVCYRMTETEFRSKVENIITLYLKKRRPTNGN